MQNNFETTSMLDFNDSHQNINKAVHSSQRSSFMFQYFPPIFSLALTWLQYIASEAATLRMQIWILKMHGNYKQATITSLSMSHKIKGEMPAVRTRSLVGKRRPSVPVSTEKPMWKNILCCQIWRFDYLASM